MNEASNAVNPVHREDGLVEPVQLIKDLQFWRLRECEVEPGLGEEAVDEARPVLHALGLAVFDV